MKPKSFEWLPNPDNPKLTCIQEDWRSYLLLGPRGSPLGCVANALAGFRHAPEWRGVLHFNGSSLATVVRLPPPIENAPAVPFCWADDHDVLAAEWLQREGISVNREIAGQAINAISREHPFHPVRDYLDSLKWDGVKRIDCWLTLFMGVEPSDYSRAVAAKFLIGAVARVYNPGAKNDTCPIFEGPQGALKSTALRTLAGDEFFTDDISELGSKDSALQTRGVWIIELAELDALTRGELSRAKAFMSRQVDRIRPPYGKRPVSMPRECVFAGTVNKETYLKDETGGRRFWPVKCGDINIPDLRRDRDQLWAEACERFRAGDTWWLDNDALREAAAKEVEARYEPDPWDDLIFLWIDNPTRRYDPAYQGAALLSTAEYVTVTDILIHCLGKRLDTWGQMDQTRVARSLTSRGWKRYQKRVQGEREWRYRRPGVSPLSPVGAT